MRWSTPAYALVVLFASAPAYAGGVGPMVMGGFHTEPVAFYSSEIDGGEGPVIPDLGSYEQFLETQIIGNAGGGLELMLGDRDDLIQGVFRGFYMVDLPQHQPDPNNELVDADALVVAIREDVRHLGLGTVGINFGVARAVQNKLKFSVALHLGAAFATFDQAEFFLGQLGGNLSYLVRRNAEVYVDVSYGLRARKDLSHGLYGAAGVRVLFD